MQEPACGAGPTAHRAKGRGGVNEPIQSLAQTTQQALADAGAAIPFAAFLGIALADWEIYVNIGVGMIGMVAGTAAAWWHIEKIRETRRARRQRVREDSEQDPPVS